jgi:hypothetical protein
LKNDDLQFKKNISPEAKDLLKKILKTDPTKRITLEKIFQHPFIKKHIDEYENDKEVFKYIPQEPEYEFDPEGYNIDMKDSLSPSRIGDSGKTLKQIQEEEFLKDSEAQQKFVQKKLQESKINPADVKRVYFKRDEEGNLRMKIEMNTAPKIRHTDRTPKKMDEAAAPKIEKVITESINEGKPRIQNMDQLFDDGSPIQQVVPSNIPLLHHPPEQTPSLPLPANKQIRIDQIEENENLPKTQPKAFQFTKVEVSPLPRPQDAVQTISSADLGQPPRIETQTENIQRNISAQQNGSNSERSNPQNTFLPPQPQKEEQLEYTIKPVANKLPLKQHGSLPGNQSEISQKNSPQKIQTQNPQNEDGSKSSDQKLRLQSTQTEFDGKMSDQKAPRQQGHQNQDSGKKEAQNFYTENRGLEPTLSLATNSPPLPSTGTVRQVLQPVQQPFAITLVQANQEQISNNDHSKNQNFVFEGQNKQPYITKPANEGEIKQKTGPFGTLGKPLVYQPGSNSEVPLKEAPKEINLKPSQEHKTPQQDKPFPEKTQTNPISSMNTLPPNPIQNANKTLYLPSNLTINDMRSNPSSTNITMPSATIESKTKAELRVEGPKPTIAPLKPSLGMSKSSNNSLKNLFQDNNFNLTNYKETVFNYLNQPALSIAEPKQEAKGATNSPPSKQKELEKAFPNSPLRLKIPNDPHKYARREDPHKHDQQSQNNEKNQSQKRESMEAPGRQLDRRSNIAAKTQILKIPDGFQKHSDGIYRNRPENSDMSKVKKDQNLNTSSSFSKPLNTFTERPSIDQIQYQPLMKRNSKGASSSSNRNSVSLTESRRNDQAQRIISQMDGYHLKREEAVRDANPVQADPKRQVTAQNEKSGIETSGSKNFLGRGKIQVESSRVEAKGQVFGHQMDTNKVVISNRETEGEKIKVKFKETINAEENSRPYLI